MSRKKILFLTGTRADFGKVKPLIRELENLDKFESAIFVTGMHMLSRYGYTLIEVQKAGFKNIFTYINQVDSNLNQMDLVLANTIQGLGYYIREFTPDLIVVHGDRVEALAGAIVGALNNILVAHLEGGELSGTIDELIRHAITKLSHLHFVANDEARQRLNQMGEIDDSVFVIGSPDIDIMLSDTLPTIDEVKRYYEINFSEYAILVYHSVTTELSSLRNNIEVIMQALRISEKNYVAIYPNNDSGSDVIIETLLSYKNDPHFRLLPSMRFEYFLTLLKHAQVIVGNSSAGIREAPVYGVPTVNIGTRQMNRYYTPSIINTKEDMNEILKALGTLPARFSPSLYFGRGQSAQLFVEQLQNPTMWNVSRQKQFCDLKIELSEMRR